MTEDTVIWEDQKKVKDGWVSKNKERRVTTVEGSDLQGQG